MQTFKLKDGREWKRMRKISRLSILRVQCNSAKFTKMHLCTIWVIVRQAVHVIVRQQ